MYYNILKIISEISHHSHYPCKHIYTKLRRLGLSVVLCLAHKSAALTIRPLCALRDGMTNDPETAIKQYNKDFIYNGSSHK